MHRLYFTTFPDPPPKPALLNKLAAEYELPVRVRRRFNWLPSLDADATYYFFTIDDQLLYLSFFQDWGPLNIAMVYKACILIRELLEVWNHARHPVMSACHS
jgi:cell division cycle 14